MTKDLHEVELISMVDTKLGQSSIWIQTVFTLKREEEIKINKLRKSSLYQSDVVLKWHHLVGIDVLENRLSLARILNKTLHWVSDKGIGEHVGDVVKVLWANV